jgi:hypothetical protein
MPPPPKLKTVPYSQITSNYLGLPRLPIPALADTARRYEASVTALKKQSTVDNHVAVFRKFLETDGARVQKALVERDTTAATSGTYPFSYIEKHWDDMYLNYRGPSPINIAPAFTLKPLGERIRELVDPADISQQPSDHKPDVQCYTAAHVVHGMLRFAQKMVEQGIDAPAEPVGFDISGLSRQFGFTRLPCAGRDSNKHVPIKDAMGHIIVMHRGHVFRVDTRDESGHYYSPKQLARAFANITRSTPKQPHFCVGAVTGGPRDEWAMTRKLMESASDTNDAYFDSVDSAFTVVCLDSASWASDLSQLLPGMLTGVVRGDGVVSTSRAQSKRVSDDVVNRWYDKHMVIVDNSDAGRVGCNFEHAFSDGLCWSRYFGEVYNDLVGAPSGFSPLPALSPAADAGADAPDARNLQWVIGDESGQVATTVRNAVEVIDRHAASVYHAAAPIPYGKKAIKKMGVSPDAFCQAAFHLSYFRLHQKIAPTYESCSTARFFHGRTETIRTATVPMYALITRHADFAAAREGTLSSETKAELRGLVEAAGKAHVQLARDASNGQGVDRHLLALREMSRELEAPTAMAFFNENMYEFSGTWAMSTSNVSQPFIDWFNFGPVVSDGYGLGYNIQDDCAHTSVSTFKAVKWSAASDMSEQVLRAADDIAAVLS